MKGIVTIVVVFLALAQAPVTAQTKQEVSRGNFDTLNRDVVKVISDSIKTDTATRKVHSPRKATLRSALIPGWGQAYNKQYWKIPLVYALVGIPAGTYFYNNSWYKKSKYAYNLRIQKDSLNFPSIDPKLEVLSTESLRFYRNEFRRNRDYSILYTLIAWGLNVVDATVSGHLKEFDVSDDLSLRVNPIVSPGSKGLSLVLAFRQPSPKVLLVR